MQVRPDHRRLSQRGHELVVDVVDLDRREAQPLDALDRAGRSDQAGELHAGGAVAEAAEVDAGEDDLAVALRHPLPDLAEHGLGAARASRAPHERDHAERARERAAVLDLHEGANAVELRIGLDAADRADVAGDGLDRLLDLARNDRDVRGKPGEGGLGEPGPAAGHVHARMRASRSRGGLARLREALVRDAARVHDGNVAASLHLAVAVAEQPLAQRLRVGLRDLAAEETDGEARHRAAKSTDARADRPPSHRPGRAARSCSPRGAGRRRRGSRT